MPEAPSRSEPRRVEPAWLPGPNEWRRPESAAAKPRPAEAAATSQNGAGGAARDRGAGTARPQAAHGAGLAAMVGMAAEAGHRGSLPQLKVGIASAAAASGGNVWGKRARCVFIAACPLNTRPCCAVDGATRASNFCAIRRRHTPRIRSNVRVFISNGRVSSSGTCRHSAADARIHDVRSPLPPSPMAAGLLAAPPGGSASHSTLRDSCRRFKPTAEDLARVGLTEPAPNQEFSLAVKKPKTTQQRGVGQPRMQQRQAAARREPSRAAAAASAKAGLQANTATGSAKAAADAPYQAALADRPEPAR